MEWTNAVKPAMRLSWSDVAALILSSMVSATEGKESKSDWFERDSTGVLLLCAGEAGGKSGWPLLFLKLVDE